MTKDRPMTTIPLEPIARRSVLRRMLRVMRLDRSVYAEIARDPTGPRQGGRVVSIVAAAVAVGAVLDGGWQAGEILGAVLAALSHWLVWGGLMYLVARFVFHGSTSWRTLLERLGYAQAPQVLGILSFVPVVGPVVVLASRLLTAVAGHQATHHILGLRRWQELTTQLVTFAIAFLLAALVQVSVGGVDLFDGLARP